METILDDRLPTLQRAATWNAWFEEEKLLQFAGHLRGRALQEWSLLGDEDKSSFEGAIEALREKLDPGSKAMAAQDFRHISQGDQEKVADFIHHLEHTFKVAYGRGAMSVETRGALLHGQLQDGLKYEIMRAPSVSGSQTYKELCLAARNEEKRLAELRKRQQYGRIGGTSTGQRKDKRSEAEGKEGMKHKDDKKGQVKKCFICNKPGHLTCQCRARSPESKGQFTRKTPTNTQRVDSAPSQKPTQDGPQKGHCEQGNTSAPSQEPAQKGHCEQDNTFTILDILFSSDDEETKACLVHVKDAGSCPQRVHVEITIMGGELFRKVAAVAHLKKKQFKKPDKTPHNYDQSPFKLDGRMDLQLTFDEKAIVTPVYIKMDAREQLLLSEGVCRQLGIIHYHPLVKPHGKKTEEQTSTTSNMKSKSVVEVPTVSVNTVESVRVLQGQSSVVMVQLDTCTMEGPVLLQQSKLTEKLGLYISEGIVQPTGDGKALAVITNHLGFTQKSPAGTIIGSAEEADMVMVPSEPKCTTTDDSNSGTVRTVKEAQVNSCGQKLLDLVGKPDLMDTDQLEGLRQFLTKHNQVFALEPGEHGETDLVQLKIDTTTSNETDALCSKARSGKAAEGNAERRNNSSLKKPMG